MAAIPSVEVTPPTLEVGEGHNEDDALVTVQQRPVSAVQLRPFSEFSVTSIESALHEFQKGPSSTMESIPLSLDVDWGRGERDSLVVRPNHFSDTSFMSISSALEADQVKSDKPMTSGPAPKVTKRVEDLGRFRHIQFTVYRRIFTTVFVVNLLTLIILMLVAKGIPYRSAINTASSVNLMVAILGRQENVVNWCYEAAVYVPHWLPLFIRRRLAKVFHYGGIHSGCGAAATIWFLLQTIMVTMEYPQGPTSLLLSDLITSWALILLLLIMLLSAYPSFRRKCHNQFEMLHRFAGWTALAIFWTHLIIIVLEAKAEEPADHKRSFGYYIVITPSLWLLLVSTICGVLSWSRIRLRDVQAEKLSSHAIRLHFHYKDMPPFYGIKVSDDPMLEWHSFATIPNEGGKGRGFSILISNAGDWTNKIIQTPPTKLWIRGYPIHGVSFTAQLFKRVVVVATGTGIGPILSLFAARSTPCRVLWSTPNPLKTFGQKIIDEVHAADPNAIIWNTREHGRPDLIALTYRLYQDFNAEAVYVISNPPVTKKVVLDMNVRGVPAYGVIYDS